MKTWIMVLLGLVLSSGAMADGNKLLLQCQEFIKLIDEDRVLTPNAGICVGRVATVNDFMAGMKDSLPPTVKACLPKEGVSLGQATRIVTKYLNDNPSSLHLSETVLIVLAFRDAFPCR